MGKQLENCNKLPIVKFSPIQHNLPNLIIKEYLSTDQKYLHEICISISSSARSTNLSLKSWLIHDGLRWQVTFFGNMLEQKIIQITFKLNIINIERKTL